MITTCDDELMFLRDAFLVIISRDIMFFSFIFGA